MKLFKFFNPQKPKKSKVEEEDEPMGESMILTNIEYPQDKGSIPTDSFYKKDFEDFMEPSYKKFGELRL